MADTIIDKLIVTVGLDPSNFKKGQAETTKALKETKQRFGETTDQATKFSKAIEGLTKEFVGLFIGVKGLGDVVGFFSNLNASVRALGYNSKNLGIAAGELKDWQNAAVLAGGSAEGVTKAIGALQQSIFNRQFNGQISEQVIAFSRLGIQLEDMPGHLRPLHDLWIDTAKAMERLHMDQAQKYQLLTGPLGLDAGTVNLILQGSAALEAAYQAQEQLRQVTKDDTDAAQALGSEWEKTGQKISSVATGLLTKVNPTPDRIADFFGSKWLLNLWGGLSDMAFGSSPSGTKQSATGTIDRSGAGFRNNNPGNVKAIGPYSNLPSDSRGFAIFPDLATGQKAAADVLGRYSTSGANTIASIVKRYEGRVQPGNVNDIPAYISDVSKRTGIDPNKALSAAEREQVMQAMFGHEYGFSQSKVSSLLGASPGALSSGQGPSTTPAVSGAGPSGGIPVTQNSTQIDSITVVTQAQDANGIASDIQRAMQRKFGAAQADVGFA